MGGRKWREREIGRGKRERSNRRKFRIPRFLLRPREFFPFLFLGRLLLAWRRRRPCDEDDHHEGGMRNIKGLFLQYCGLLSLSLSHQTSLSDYSSLPPSIPPPERDSHSPPPPPPPIPAVKESTITRGRQEKNTRRPAAAQFPLRPILLVAARYHSRVRTVFVVVGEGHLAKKVQPHSLGRGDCRHGNLCHSSPFLLHTGECTRRRPSVGGPRIERSFRRLERAPTTTTVFLPLSSTPSLFLSSLFGGRGGEASEVRKEERTDGRTDGAGKTDLRIA